MTAKLNNNQKHPKANHQPRQKAAERIGRAQARQEHYDSLTLEQKIAMLPPEPYSKKQRARLLAALEKRNAPKPEPKKDEPTQVASGVTNKQQNQKKYMKGAK